MGRNVKLKVCGMRDPSNIVEVGLLQPDFMGFIFFEKSPRYVGEDFKIPEDFSPTIKRIGVFVNASTEHMLTKVEQLNLNYLQLHGEESVEQIKVLHAKGIKLIKVFSVDENFNFSETEPFVPYVTYFLFDTKGKYYGGNAYAFNWNILKNYSQKIPFFLSGGITAENIGAIKSIDYMNLFAVDLNSGVEISPGLKSTEQILRLQKLLNTISLS